MSKRDRVLDPGEPRDPRRPDDAGGRPGEERARGAPPPRRAGDAAGRAHHERHGQPRVGAASASARGSARAAARGTRPPAVVEARSYSRNSGADSCEATTWASGCRRRSSGHDGSLVRRVAEGEEEADGDRLGVAQVGQRVEVERGELAVRPDPPADAEGALERDERLRMPGAEPVELGAVLPAQVEDVLEARGRDERRRAPRRSSSAFVAIVVPCVKRSSPPAPTAAAAASTDSSWFRAVGTFAVRSSPSSSRTASVNVPPTSMPRMATGGILRPVASGA